MGLALHEAVGPLLSLMLYAQRPLVTVFNRLYYTMGRVLHRLGRASNSELFLRFNFEASFTVPPAYLVCGPHGYTIQITFPRSKAREALVELLTGDMISVSLMSVTWSSELLVLGIGQLAVALAVFVMCLYFIVWRSARHGEQDLSTFIDRNFTYLRSLSLVADLLVGAEPFRPIEGLAVGRFGDRVRRFPSACGRRAD